LPANSSLMKTPRPKSSRLYRAARASLSARESKPAKAFEQWLSKYQIRGSAALLLGKRMLGNLYRESHLTGDNPFRNPEEFAAFLKRCSAGHSLARSAVRRHANYQDACREFERRGLRIARVHLPGRLLRYTESRNVIALLAERILGRAARVAFDLGTISAEDTVRGLELSWDSAKLRPDDMLARGSRVFATFEHAGGAPRNDAEKLSKALALSIWTRPKTGDEFLVEVSYPTDSVDDYRFPTIADAGWGNLFCPAPERRPDIRRVKTLWGWTCPLDRRLPQPEIVHANASLRVLDLSPRFVGVIPR
jgi:hypothetical protein